VTIYCECETPVMDVEHDEGCRRCARPVAFTPEPERWTIITDEGLTLFREDLLTAAEARAYVLANPRTQAGVPQHAVSESVAREAMRRWREVGERHDVGKARERRLHTAALVAALERREASDGD